MGYQSIPVQAPIEASALITGTAVNSRANQDDVESEDEDEPLAPAQGFTSFMLQPVIKTTVCDGRTLTHRVATANKENAPPTPVPTVPSKNLVRCVSGQPPQPPVSMVQDEPTAGPYSPKSISLYGCGDSTYYTKERRCQEAEDSDDEFGMAIHGVPYPQPQLYQYPDAHPNLEIFLCSQSQVTQPSTAPVVNTHMRKEHQATPAPSSHAAKKLEPIVLPCLHHQLQSSPNDPRLNHQVHGDEPMLRTSMISASLCLKRPSLSTMLKLVVSIPIQTALKIVMPPQELGWNPVMHGVFALSLMRTC
ncbi:uncharacterized protein LACBIDRAFT_316847 [Laccaria bicolor S238N-H82]|uniref:Predicted protein n=1 Tax=Laccaria bicolor (strain S238N-H82 / ATCC MYA-4686) TaxID=486041 RepID=B0E1Q9_LACBS|nr:uncharacterized protein LACBIDRAFT_316847 [Laccaria bicolor S238N-H82]EDQ99239.1 predicted protein [Laccaria bicolor S238N-H82]|eukprot:XP_001890136.1 predicted protein [Laccaria bicolor S238N-H82]